MCAGELPLLLAPGVRGCKCGWSRGGVWKTGRVSEEGELPWRHDREEAGGGGERGQGDSQGGDPPPDDGVASPGAAPPLCHAGSGGPPQQGPEEQSQQTHHRHVQVRKPFALWCYICHSLILYCHL